MAMMFVNPWGKYTPHGNLDAFVTLQMIDKVVCADPDRDPATIDLVKLKAVADICLVKPSTIEAGLLAIASDGVLAVYEGKVILDKRITDRYVRIG